VGRLGPPRRPGGKGAEDAEDALLEEQVAALALEEELPIVIMDAMLPRQVAVFMVSDDAHAQLVARCLESDVSAFDVIGIDPETRAPLHTGVEVEITGVRELEADAGDHHHSQRQRRRGLPDLDLCGCDAP
jgi:hypothetical protein